MWVTVHHGTIFGLVNHLGREYNPSLAFHRTIFNLSSTRGTYDLGVFPPPRMPITTRLQWHVVGLWTQINFHFPLQSSVVKIRAGLYVRRRPTTANVEPPQTLFFGVVHCVELWTWVTLGLGMNKVCTEAVHCVALWTWVTLGLGMCKVCTEAVHCVALWTWVTLGLDMCKVCIEAVHCVALWTWVTLGLGICKVCTEAVHCVGLWTWVTLGLGMW